MVKAFTSTSLIIFALAFAIPSVGHAAAGLSISPAQATAEAGTRVTVRVVVSGDAPFNAVSGSVQFPSDIFSIESVSKSGSVIDFWVSEPGVSGGNAVAFEGIILGGSPGSAGTVVTITLRARNEGSGSARFLRGQVLANDGQGTDITGTLSGATFIVTPASATPPPTPSVPTRIDEEELEIEEPQAPPTLTAPTIILGTRYSRPAVFGTSQYPRGQVLLTFVGRDSSKIFITGVTDGAGEFVLSVPRALKRGVYEVSAVIVQEDGAHSYSSNTRIVRVGSIFSDMSWDEWSLLLLVLFVVSLVVLYSARRKRERVGISSSAKRELREAQGIIRKSFDILRSDVRDSIGNKKSAQERARATQLIDELDDAERTIEKEVKDIEKP